MVDGFREIEKAGGPPVVFRVMRTATAVSSTPTSRPK
jgi:hypothetical protein